MLLLYYLRDMLQLVLAPVKGWEDISADGLDARQLLVKGLIPFVAIVSLSVLVRLIYNPDISVIVLLQQVVISFIKYFVTYFIATFAFTLYLPGVTDGELSLTKCHTFIIYGTGLLALCGFIQNLMPVDMALVLVLPIYVFYILWRGLRYLNISFNGVGTFMLITLFAVVVPPYFIQYFFNLILPS